MYWRFGQFVLDVEIGGGGSMHLILTELKTNQKGGCCPQWRDGQELERGGCRAMPSHYVAQSPEVRETQPLTVTHVAGGVMGHQFQRVSFRRKGGCRYRLLYNNRFLSTDFALQTVSCRIGRPRSDVIRNTEEG